MNDVDEQKPGARCPEKSDSESSLIKFSAAFVATLTLVLILLGFGVSLAVEEKLRLPHSSLFESSVELLDLGSVAVIEILPKMLKGLGDVATYLGMLAQVWSSIWILMVLYLVSVAIVFYVKYILKIDVKGDRVKAVFALKGEKGFLVKAAMFLLALIASAIFPIFWYFGLVLGMVFLAMVPLVGAVAGMAYVDEVAINNHRCAPLPSVALYQAQKAKQLPSKTEPDGKQEDYVQCVRVVKEGNEVARGHFVLATSKAVVLYLPNGVGRRIPIGDSVIEVVDTLQNMGDEKKAER